MRGQVRRAVPHQQRRGPLDHRHPRGQVALGEHEHQRRADRERGRQQRDAPRARPRSGDHHRRDAVGGHRPRRPDRVVAPGDQDDDGRVDGEGPVGGHFPPGTSQDVCVFGAVTDNGPASGNASALRPWPPWLCLPFLPTPRPREVPTQIIRTNPPRLAPEPGKASGPGAAPPGAPLFSPPPRGARDSGTVGNSCSPSLGLSPGITSDCLRLGRLHEKVPLNWDNRACRRSCPSPGGGTFPVKNSARAARVTVSATARAWSPRPARSCCGRRCG